MEQESVVLKRGPKTNAGKTTMEKHAEFDAIGKAKISIEQNGEMTLQTKKQVTALLKKDKQNVKKDKVKPTVTVGMLIDSLADTGLKTDQNRNGFTNWRDSKKHILFYAIDRKNFVAYNVRSDSTKSGWKSERLTTEEELDALVESIRKQMEVKTKFTSAFTPFFRCPECKFETMMKSEMQTHIGTHRE